jgi:hypothetical protein
VATNVSEVHAVYILTVEPSKARKMGTETGLGGQEYHDNGYEREDRIRTGQWETAGPQKGISFRAGRKKINGYPLYGTQTWSEKDPLGK